MRNSARSLKWLFIACTPPFRESMNIYPRVRTLSQPPVSIPYFIATSWNTRTEGMMAIIHVLPGPAAKEAPKARSIPAKTTRREVGIVKVVSRRETRV